MDEELSGFMAIKKYMDLQHDKLDLALETINQLAAKLAQDSCLGKKQSDIMPLAEILEQFTDRMDELWQD